jgi:DNA-binding transcriptional ArsR family regulator
MADPTRRAIIARLARGEAGVMELAPPFDMSQPAISKHLKVLERAGLISRDREAQRRPCRLVGGRLKEVTSRLLDFRRFWEQSYERLDAVLDESLFEEKDGKTTLTSTTEFQTIEDRDAYLSTGATAGGEMSMDRLEQVIASIS